MSGVEMDSKETKDASEEKKIEAPKFHGTDKKEFKIRVHVIEARELKGREDSGISDPICYVKVNGQTQKTIVMRKTLSALWDHCFFFDLEMNQAEFENGHIEFDIYDANTIRRNVLIGSTSVDLARVYFSPNHELYKQWMALTDKTEKFEGVQGYLKFSASATPEGEPLPPAHNEEEEDDDDVDTLDLQSLVLNGPDIDLQEYYVQLKVYQCVGLPQTDKGVLSGGKADPMVEIKFAGRSHRTQHKSNTLDPVFNEELFLPTSVPSLSDRIEVLVWDWDTVGKNKLIASKYFSFSKIKERSWGPSWVYFYGAPGEATGDAKGVNPEEKADDYNRGYKEGTSYRGKMLMELSTRPARKARIDTKSLPRPAETKTAEYQLNVDVYEGSEIVGTSGSVTLKFSVADTQLQKVKSQTSKNGAVKFFSQIDQLLTLPSNLDFENANGESPDLLVECFVKSWTGNKQRCGFLRIKLKDILGFDNAPKWFTFKQDLYSFKYNESQVPGDILLKLGFGPSRKAPEERPHLADIERKKYQLRANIYQGRMLPAADSNGLSDPYILVRMGGHSIKTEIKKETVNPTWYVTKTIDLELPTPLDYAPDINVLVYDWDRFSGDDLMGRFRVSANAVGKKLPKEPTWYPLYMDDPEDTEGEMLCSFQLIPADEADELKMPDITPKFRDCYFEVNAVGLRGMLPYRLSAISNPLVEFDTGQKESRNRTRGKARVTGRDCDLLETVHLSVPLPVKEIYAPVINVRVFDQRALGEVLVGSTSIPITPYLPWTAQKKKKAGLPRKATIIPGAKGSSVDKPPELDEEGDPLEPTSAGSKSKSKKDKKKSKKKKSKKKKKKRKKKKKHHDGGIDEDDEDGEEEEEPSSDEEDVRIDINDELTVDSEIAEVPEQDFEGEFDDEDEMDESETDSDEEKKVEQKQTDMELEFDLAEDIPFEEFKLFRGKSRGLSYFEKMMAKGKKQGTRSTVGTFKGRFRVIENSQLRYVDDPINLKSVYKPKKKVIRVYIFKGTSIVPSDDNGFSDPYIIVDSGIERTSKKDGAQVDKTQEPEFFKCWQVNTVIPGPTLKVECWDHDTLSADDLIGETVIDLENRFFCPKWVAMEPKPLEWRTLWTDVSRSPQGKLLMYVEILTPDQAKVLPIRNIAPPPPKPFELRLVIWETKNCAPKDEKKSDIFVSAIMDGQPRSERQETDSHWNSKDGTGSFNWRMKFPLSLPYPNPRLKIQIWDKDIVSANDIIAEAILNLSKFFRRAFKTGKGFEQNDKWISCYHPNTPNVVQGEVKVTMELLDQKTADARDNGYGRREPNQYPVLPKPDRPASSFNPLNPLGWIKLGAGSLFKKLKILFGVAVVCGIIAVIIYFSA